jgi:alkylation response protein AidB-like acyl-CoA dehydrogenase
MDVRPSPEQQSLRDAVAHLVSRLAPGSVGALDDGERAAKLEAAVAGAGWRELRTASDDGTPWASGVEAAIVAEELAAGLADTSFVGPTLAAELRRLAGAPPAERPETIALTADLSTLGGDVAVDAAGADSALVLVDGELRSLPLGTGDAQVDLTRPCAVVKGDGVPVDGLVTAEAAQRVTVLGLALACADLVGVMRGAVRLARDYAVERKQYGVAVGSFQAVQHLLADAHVAMEGSRSVALHAAWAVDALPVHEALAAGAIAKAYCARAARTVTETCIQVHGGIGNTWDCLAHVHLRRALLSTDLFGGVGPSLDRVLAARGIGGDRALR